MNLLERLNELIRTGEIILQDAGNMEFCCKESLWYAPFYDKDLEASSDEWCREVLYFLKDEFGKSGIICNDLKLHIQSCYTLEDEKENIRSCLDVLQSEASLNFCAQKHRKN